MPERLTEPRPSGSGPQSEPDAFDRLVARAEELTRVFEQHPNPAVREDALELLQTIDLIHRDAILRLVEIVVGSGDHQLIEQAAEDPKVGALLLLYDVLPLPELLQWQESLDSVRSVLKDRHADVELLRITDGMPHLRLKGSFKDAEESPLRELVQEHIQMAFGGYQSLKWEPRDRPPAPPRFVSIDTIKPAKRQRWVDLLAAGDLPIESMTTREVEKMAVLLCHSGSGFHAYPNACPGSALPLHMGQLSVNTLICPWHNCTYDVRTGTRKSGVGKDLQPLTIRVEAGRVQLGIWE